MVKGVKLESVRKAANRLNTYLASRDKKEMKADFTASKSRVVKSAFLSGLFTADGSFAFDFAKRGRIRLRLLIRQPTDVSLLDRIVAEMGVGKVWYETDKNGLPIKHCYTAGQDDLKPWFDYFDPYPPNGTKYIQYLLTRYLYHLVFQNGFQVTLHGKYTFWKTYEHICYFRLPKDQAETRLNEVKTRSHY